jgi:hypothetical protein
MSRRRNGDMNADGCLTSPREDVVDTKTIQWTRRQLDSVRHEIEALLPARSQRQFTADENARYTELLAAEQRLLTSLRRAAPDDD